MNKPGQLTVEFGLIKDYPDAIIDYKGHGETGVTILIDFLGTASGKIRINNVTRNETLILDTSKISSVAGSNITKYDSIVIDTTRGSKTARLLRDGKYYNILKAIDLSSKWLQLQTGKNQFTATIDTGLENMKVSVSYSTRVLGV